MKFVMILRYAFSVAYPVFIFLSITVFHLPIRIIGILVIVIAFSIFLIRKKDLSSSIMPLSLIGIALIVVLTNNEKVLKCYPLIVNMLLFIPFALSLRNKQNMILSFATMVDRSISWNSHYGTVERYCRKVTIVWCLFFALNMIVSAFTIFYSSSFVWALYNGLISYILMGCLFVGEFFVRFFVQKRDLRSVAFSELVSSSREDDWIITYSGDFSEGKYKRWNDYLQETAKLREFLKTVSEKKVILHADDYWYFLLGLSAILQTGHELVLSANCSTEFISDIKDEDTVCLFDQDKEGVYNIVDIIEHAPEAAYSSLPPISKDSLVYLFTSGSTGKPQVIQHCFGELEEDNDALGEYWRGNFKHRILLSTVNPHHAFGLVFAVLKPFINGIPIRRERVLEPAEFNSSVKEKYLIITTPSFLRMSLDDELFKEKKMNNPFIICAGGPLSREHACGVEKIFGVFPLEIYGSTETGAVGWRINKNDEAQWWHPTKSVQISLAEDGCLVFSCDGIHGDSFHTADLAQIRKDGRYLLQGRKDSIVKIAEKRVSLNEVASRIEQTGLCSESVVICMNSTSRSYLASVVVLSSKGATLFESLSHGEKVKHMRKILADSLESVTIPRRWRFVSKIPTNDMGKIDMVAIRCLFEEGV